MKKIVNLLIVATGLAFPLRAQEIVPLQRAAGIIRLDGIINEEAWELVSPLTFVMYAPTHEGPLTEKTDIRITYDDEYLYLAARCFDKDPSEIHATSYARDGLNPGDDAICLVLDTFNDNENALAFLTNPVGLREDWAIANDGEPLLEPFPFNSSWSTFWDVAAHQTPEGWFAEMRIPLSSLRFKESGGEVTMGMIVWRYIARKNELHVFPNIPPKWGWSIIKPSQAQKISLQGIQRKNPVYITPYILGGSGRGYELAPDSTGYNRESSVKRELGLDLKYGVTSNLTLDLTLNTDFAQVEADDQQVNLTRFSLFFPEKRLFFQERASIFDVPLGGPNRLFYSRQIGISEEEEKPVRIYGGARLVGRLGDWDIGFLDMHTERSSDLPSENFGVLRVRRQVLNPNSYAGTMYTSRVGNDGSFNHAYGLDATLRVSENDYLFANWAQTFDHELVKPKMRTGLNVARARLQLEKRTTVGFGYEGSFSYTGRDFDPAMGFVQRVNNIRIGDRIFYGWLSSEDSPFFNHVITLRTGVFLNNDDSSVESSEVGPEWTFSFKSGAFGQISAKAITEVLTEPFELSDDITIPTGRYHFYNANALFNTPWGNLLKSSFTFDIGTFYDGTRTSIGAMPSWSISSHFELSGEYQYNRIRFTERNQLFNTHIGRLRLKLNIDTRLSASTFAQYSSESHLVSINFRFRYNPQEGNDLYLVYNEGINTDRYRDLPIRPFSEDRTFLLKYSHTFQY